MGCESFQVAGILNCAVIRLEECDRILFRVGHKTSCWLRDSTASHRVRSAIQPLASRWRPVLIQISDYHPNDKFMGTSQISSRYLSSHHGDREPDSEARFHVAPIRGTRLLPLLPIDVPGRSFPALLIPTMPLT